ncbi:MAG: hypothetical protein HQ483_00225 [Rhodospirillales bacterium]|nr:hypothetical protein [Rhodospirillales bacterium]
MAILNSRAGFAAVVSSIFFVLFFSAAKSEEVMNGPNIINHLRQEPTTLFDSGMKLLRRQALDMARRLNVPDQKPVGTRVRYNPDSGLIEIRFTFSQRSEYVNGQNCWEARARIIQEMLQIGTTIYPSKASYGERISRRIGLMFSHESTARDAEIFSESGQVSKIGKGLTRIIYFEVEQITDQNSSLVNCRGPITQVNRNR